MSLAKPVPRWLVLVAAALPLVLLAGALVAARGDDGEAEGDEPKEAVASPYSGYAREVRAEFAVATEPLVGVTTVSAEWLGGEADDAALAAALDDAEAALPDLRSGVAALDEPDGAAPARLLLLSSIDLYGASVAAHREALAAAGGERTELDLLARRVRGIAERLYDRAIAVVDPAAASAGSAVPDWSQEGLAPGDLLRGAGAVFDQEAEAIARGGDEPARRQALRMLLLAESERARVLDRGDLAGRLEQVFAALEAA